MQQMTMQEKARPLAGIKFLLGETYATRGAMDSFSSTEIQRCIDRHARGDWGNVFPDDWERNQRGLRTCPPGRLLSIYNFPDGSTLWVVTESDRIATIALLPEEY